MPHLRTRFRWAEPLAVEPREDDADVVGPAPLVGQRDELVTGDLQVPLAPRDLGDLLFLDQA